MKKIVLLVALAVIFAVAAPVMAGPYSDVPASHWAYDAVNTLSATGIITGFPDGTFKGNDTLTRYQIAVLVGRVLDAVEAETALLNEKVEAVENGLTAGQAEDVIAIFKSLLAKYSPEADMPENLTAIQAEEVAGIVEALSLEFKFELEAMGKDVDGLLERMAAAEGRLDALEVVTFGGEYGLNLTKTTIEGTAYTDPFDLSSDEFTTDDDVFRHTLGLNVAVNKAPIVLDVNMTLGKDVFGTWSVDENTEDYGNDIAEDSGFDDTLGFDFDDFNATITTDALTATIDNEQAVSMNDYLLGDPDLTYDGVVVNAGESIYVLARNKTANEDTEQLLMDEDTKDAAEQALLAAGFTNAANFFILKVVDGENYYYVDQDEKLALTEADYNDLETENYSVYKSIEVYDDGTYGLIPAGTEDVAKDYTVKDVLAVQQDLGLLGSKLFVGVDNIFDEAFVAGIDSEFNVLGTDINTTVAVSDKDVAENKLVRLAVSRNLGPIELAAGYRIIDENFVGLYDEGDYGDSGYDVSASLPVGPLTVNGSYTSVTDDEDIINAGVTLDELNLLGFGLTGSFEQDLRNRDADTKADRQKRNVELSKDLFGIELAAGYKYDQYTDYADDPVYGEEETVYDITTDADDVDFYQYDIFDNKLEIDEWQADDLYNNIYANMNWDTFVPGLSVNAAYDYSIADKENEELNFGADLTMGILSLGASHDVVDEETVLSAGAEYSIFAVDFEQVLDGDRTITASVDPDAYNVFGVDVDTAVDFKMLNDMMNYGGKVDLSKSYDALTLNTGYAYANHAIDEKSDEYIVGQVATLSAGLDYAVTEDIAATLSYQNKKVFGDAYTYEEDHDEVDLMNKVEGYDSHVQQVKAGLSFSF